MATGDTDDMTARLRSVLPPWFPDQGQAPILDAILQGIAANLAFAYALYAYIKLQTRIGTATDAFLDLIAWDFFGARFLRSTGELDASFRTRVLRELVRPRVTRQAISDQLQYLTGVKPRIVEPWQTDDTGYIDGPSFYDVDTVANPFRLADTAMHNQIFIDTILPPFRPFGNNPTPCVDVSFYYDAAGSSLLDASRSTPLGAQAIYDAIIDTKAAGIMAWVRLLPPQTEPHWDEPGQSWDQGQTWQP